MGAGEGRNPDKEIETSIEVCVCRTNDKAWEKEKMSSI